MSAWQLSIAKNTNRNARQRHKYSVQTLTINRFIKTREQTTALKPILAPRRVTLPDINSIHWYNQLSGCIQENVALQLGQRAFIRIRIEPTNGNVIVSIFLPVHLKNAFLFWLHIHNVDSPIKYPSRLHNEVIANKLITKRPKIDFN